MATKKQTLTKLRAICASLGELDEGTHFDAIAFKSGGKMFATYRDLGDDCEIVFALQRERMQAALESGSRYTKYPRAPAIAIRGSAIDDWDELAKYLGESHALQAPKKSKPAKPAAKRR